MTRDEREQALYAGLLGSARRRTPAYLRDKVEDIVQDTIIAVMKSKPTEDWLDISFGYYIVALGHTIINQQRYHNFPGPQAIRNPFSLNSLAANEEEHGDNFVAHNDTARDAINNIRIRGILNQPTSVGLRSALALACGWPWDAVKKSEKMAQFSVYRYVQAARRELKEMGYA